MFRLAVHLLPIKPFGKLEWRLLVSVQDCLVGGFGVGLVSQLVPVCPSTETVTSLNQSCTCPPKPFALS